MRKFLYICNNWVKPNLDLRAVPNNSFTFARFLIRPQQWAKNFFVFLPLFFSKNITNGRLFLTCIIVFAAFCAISSCIYCINDVVDAESDKLHPVKKNRPIASGKISKKQGLGIAAMLFVISTVLVAFSGEYWLIVAGILGFYFLMNIAYCFYLKRKPIVDVFCIAIGFVLRILVGGLSIGIAISHWIMLMTFLLALFLAIAKRRDDVINYERTGIKSRDNVDRYNSTFMNLALGIVAAITVVCYIMYTVSDEVVARVGSPFLYTTSIFVLAGIIRYLQVTIVDSKSGSPTKILFEDRFIQACIVSWGLLFTLILYIL